MGYCGILRGSRDGAPDRERGRDENEFKFGQNADVHIASNIPQ